MSSFCVAIAMQVWHRFIGKAIVTNRNIGDNPSAVMQARFCTARRTDYFHPPNLLLCIRSNRHRTDIDL
jgi:hypothetical protein